MKIQLLMMIRGEILVLVKKFITKDYLFKMDNQPKIPLMDFNPQTQSKKE